MNKSTFLSDPIFKTEVQVDDARFCVILKKGFFLTRKEDSMWLHCHPDYEVHYVTRGAFQFRFETESISCAADTVVVLPPKCYHTIDPIVEGSVKVSFEVSLARQGTGKAYAEYAETFNSLKQVWSTTCHIPEFHQINEMLQCRKDYEALYRLNTALGLGLIRIAQCIRGETDSSTNVNIPLLSKKKDDVDVVLALVLNYIEENAASGLTLERLAKDMNLSARQIQRILRERMNDSFLNLLNRYRVMIAVRALQSGGRNLSRIAEESGFSSYSAFCKYFQRYRGCTPESYRENLKIMPEGEQT